MEKENGKKKLKYCFILFCILFFIAVLCLLYYFIYVPNKKYTNQDFGIETYVSLVDRDNDGIDDQTDILNNVKKYIRAKPKYESKYYANGYPDDEYGVCTDVVGFGLLDAGYDLKELVNQDIIANKKQYHIDTPDKNIDFRRVRNLEVYFKNHAISLTTDIQNIKEWQGGDIVIFREHIGIVSDKRNQKGIPYIIHHAHPFQFQYEQDILEKYPEIRAHYRIS